MNLRTLLAQPSAPGIVLTGLAEHTDEVEAGFGFLAVAANDEVLARHCVAAQSRGASVVLIDATMTVPSGLNIPTISVAELGENRGTLAARFYQDPSDQLHCVGVTGTNGKTSVAFHIADLAQHLGLAAGYSGTLGWGELADLQASNMTTANAVALQRQLAWMQQQDMQLVALEISSHALTQRRADAVQIEIGVFTNLSRDHLDYHASFSEYAAAKQRLFEAWQLKAAVINIDDEFGQVLATKVAAPVVTYGCGGDWSWQFEVSGSGLDVTWQTPAGSQRVWLPVLADYAVANITAAMAVLHTMGVAVADIMATLQQLNPVPGRMEIIPSAPGQPTVVVDFAHTPDALSKALAALRPFCSGRIICVVGCGGDRDQGKRPLMGQAALAGADVVWFTSDNPRSEDPQVIVSAMRAGVVAEGVFEEIDRALAIRQAVNGAAAGDIVLVAGKGHENYQEQDGQRTDFDDRHWVQAVLAEIGELH